MRRIHWAGCLLALMTLGLGPWVNAVAEQTCRPEVIRQPTQRGLWVDGETSVFSCTIQHSFFGSFICCSLDCCLA